MAEIATFIWSWLERGYNLAIGHAKTIWNETKAIFKMAMDALGSVSSRFQACVSYSQETSWKKEYSAKVESGTNKVDFRFGVSNEGSSRQGGRPPSNPEEGEGMEAFRDVFGGLAKYFEKLAKIADEDRDHKNQQKTVEKLMQLNQEEETKELHRMLDKNACSIN